MNFFEYTNVFSVRECSSSVRERERSLYYVSLNTDWEHKLSRTLKMLVHSKNFTRSQFSLCTDLFSVLCIQAVRNRTQFSLCTDLFCVLCIQTVRSSVCELCSVRYVRFCVHVHKHFNRNEEFFSRYSECVCVLYRRHSVQYINVAYYRVFFRTLVKIFMNQETDAIVLRKKF